MSITPYDHPTIDPFDDVPDDPTAAPEVTLPFFVYGTLRPGHGNSRMWAGHAVAEHDGTARAHGVRLLGEGAGFPYAVRSNDPTDITVGAIIRPLPGVGRYDHVLSQFDMLEGYPDHYDRVQVIIDTPDGWTRCFMYEPPAHDEFTQRRLAHLRPVPDGDWSKHRADRNAR